MTPTQQIQAILHMEFPNQLREIREQSDPTGELERFVKYVVRQTGSFGTLKAKDLKEVDWAKIVKEEMINYQQT